MEILKIVFFSGHSPCFDSDQVSQETFFSVGLDQINKHKIEKKIRSLRVVVNLLKTISDNIQ